MSDSEKAGINAVLMGAANAIPENTRAYNNAGRLELHLAPGIPSVLHEGDRLVISVTPTLKSGAECRVCTVNWTTVTPSTAAWSSLADAGTKHVATLTAISPGRVRLTIEVCPGMYFKCQKSEFVSKVIE